MFDRLLGLETEYAIRFTPRAGHTRPGNDIIYGAWLSAVREVVRTRPGTGGFGYERHFTQNGGSICYEVLPYAFEAGLLEAATPECRSPEKLLLYQRAQEALLLEARPIAERRLAAQGHPGELGLLKNCRDAEGHIYGAQENYEVEIRSPTDLLLWRLGVAALLPFALLAGLLTWAVLLLLLLLVVASALVMGLIAITAPRSRLGRRIAPHLHADSLPLPRIVGLTIFLTQCWFWWPVAVAFSWLARLTAFRRLGRELLPFVVSRPVLTGTGTLNPDGSFGLSEKGPAVRRVFRRSIHPDDRPIFDLGNLMKDLAGPMVLHGRRYLSLFRRRLRMQLGLSDSNVAQVAEYLKIATTSLMVDLAEGGHLRDAPRLARPIRALRAIAADPSLRTEVVLRGGGRIRALDLQRWYLDRAREVLRDAPATSIEVREVLRLWGEALDGLERDPSDLVGRLDWPTKRYLMEAAGGGDRPAAKKIDLRYHELGSGYLAELEAAGIAPTLVEEAEVARAIREPPADTPARIRGRLVRSLAFDGRRVRISWDRVRVGGPLGARVVRLDDHRR